MKYLIFKFILIIPFAFCSEKYESETHIFNNYISSNFPLISLKDTSVIFVIPTLNCISCLQAAEMMLLKLKNYENIYLIRTNSNQIDWRSDQLLVDSISTVDHLNLGVNSTLVIVYTGNEIAYIKGINMHNIEYLRKEIEPFLIPKMK